MSETAETMNLDAMLFVLNAVIKARVDIVAQHKAQQCRYSLTLYKA